MRYALNETPINGWKTHLGNGSAAMAVTSSGVGITRKHGAGTSAMALAATGSAYAYKYGVGSAGNVLTAQGDGTVIPFMGGQAHMVMSMTGVGVVARPNPALASLRLTAQDGSINPIARRGTGSITMVLTATYGIPANPPHTVFLTNKRDRSMRVVGEDRRFNVPADVQLRLRPERRLRVPRESRSV